MKKAKSPRKPAPKTVAEYVAGTPAPARGRLKELRALVRSAAPRGATEVISYGIPALKYKGMVTWYAAFAGHCSLFPGSAIVRAFRKDLRRYQVSKGTIQFPLDKKLPAALIKKIVRAKVAQNESKQRR